MSAEMLRLLHEPGVFDGAVASTPRCLAMAALDVRPMVAAQVIPRLHHVLVNRLADAGRHAVGSRALARADGGAAPDVVWLSERLLRSEHAILDARIEAAAARGTAMERIYLDWLAPAAEHLADQLAADFLGLADATVAFCNLRELLRRHERDFCAEKSEPASGLRALIAAPAETPSGLELPLFGLLLTAQFFRRDGWDATAERDCASAAFRDAVGNEWFDLVEILATSDRDLDAIASSIRLIRKGSPNRTIGVIACGRIFQDRPDFVRMVGADRGAIDPLSSLAEAKQFIALGSSRRLLS